MHIQGSFFGNEFGFLLKIAVVENRRKAFAVCITKQNKTKQKKISAFIYK